MRSRFLTLASILLTAGVYAQQPKPFLAGKLIHMDSMQCDGVNNDVQHTSVETANAVAAQTETPCPEYVLETNQVTYRIVSSNAKHPEPLPIGESALFRLQNGKMLLRVPAFDNQEREYIIVSMSTRESNTADSSPNRLNHLQ
jgi:hypothetical protein